MRVQMGIIVVVGILLVHAHGLPAAGAGFLRTALNEIPIPALRAPAADAPAPAASPGSSASAEAGGGHTAAEHGEDACARTLAKFRPKGPGSSPARSRLPSKSTPASASSAASLAVHPGDIADPQGCSCQDMKPGAATGNRCADWCANTTSTIIADTVRMIEKAGLEYTLSDGTLLGAVRRGGFIPGDYDGDVRILLKNGSVEDATQKLVALTAAEGYPFYHAIPCWDPGSTYPAVKTCLHWVYYGSKQSWCDVHIDELTPQQVESTFPLAKCTFEGDAYSCFKDTYERLAAKYGGDDGNGWKQACPYFRSKNEQGEKLKEADHDIQKQKCDDSEEVRGVRAEDDAIQQCLRTKLAGTGTLLRDGPG